MRKKQHAHKHATIKKRRPNHFWVVLLLSIIICAYWILGLNINEYAYRNPGLGNLYQLLWLPMIISVACLPVYLLVHLSKEQFKIKSVFWIPIFLLLATGIALLIYKS